MTEEIDNNFQKVSRWLSHGARNATNYLVDKLGYQFNKPYTYNMDIDHLFPPRPFVWRVTPPNPETFKQSYRDRLFLEEERYKYTVTRNELISTSIYGGLNQDIILYNHKASILNNNIDTLYRFHDDLPLSTRLRMELYSHYSFSVFADDETREAREEFARENPKQMEIINQYITQRKYSFWMGVGSGVCMGLRTPTHLGNWFACIFVAVLSGVFLFDPFTRYLTGLHQLDESRVKQLVADGVYSKIKEIQKRKLLYPAAVPSPTSEEEQPTSSENTEAKPTPPPENTQEKPTLPENTETEPAQPLPPSTDGNQPVSTSTAFSLSIPKLQTH